MKSILPTSRICELAPSQIMAKGVKAGKLKATKEAGKLKAMKASKGVVKVPAKKAMKASEGVVKVPAKKAMKAAKKEEVQSAMKVAMQNAMKAVPIDGFPPSLFNSLKVITRVVIKAWDTDSEEVRPEGCNEPPFLLKCIKDAQEVVLKTWDTGFDFAAFNLQDRAEDWFDEGWDGALNALKKKIMNPAVTKEDIVAALSKEDMLI